MAVDVSNSRKRKPVGTAALFGGLFAVMAGAAWITGGAMPVAAVIAGGVLGGLLVFGAVIDSHKLYIPDRVSLGLFPLGLLATWHFDPAAVWIHALGGLTAGLFLLGCDLAYRRLRGRSGIGMGDAKLFASAGAWVGPAALPGVLLIGCLSAIALLLVRRMEGDSRALSRRLAFGPHLSLGLWAIWLFGPLSWV
ncbi:A24 family peptidase [Breoghania sp. L-A4]|uniref:prepilin peptidase n=1 Tax=Breoghania sp. L-A4 TaxID=2304600 RepID=UPI0013C2DCF8|nr:A24 family peptidase [Breoghania sp. L-A4]